MTVCHIPSVAAEKELELLGKASSWLAPLFPTREHWYRWFASFLNPEYHGRLWALTHLSICNLDQIERMLASLFSQEYERIGRYRRISDLPERNTDWGLTYSNTILPVPTRYHVVSPKRMPDKIVWGILLNLAHTLLLYHEQAESHSSTSMALRKAYQKARIRFPDINPSRFTPWPHDIGARLAACLNNPNDKELVQELLQIQRKWHQRLTEDDLQKLLNDMLGFVKALDVRDGKGKSIFHLFEMTATVTVVKAAVNTGWTVHSLAAESGRHPKAILKYSWRGRTSQCEISKETEPSWDRSIDLKKFLGVNSPGFMPDIVLRFWRDEQAAKSPPDFWVFADAKRNEVTNSYVSTSIDKAITYATSLGRYEALNTHATDFKSYAPYPLVTLFFYAASHPDYRKVEEINRDSHIKAPLVIIFNIDDMRATFDYSTTKTQLHTWFELFNQHLDIGDS